jgi:hypothetical protein
MYTMLPPTMDVMSPQPVLQKRKNRSNEDENKFSPVSVTFCSDGDNKQQANKDKICVRLLSSFSPILFEPQCTPSFVGTNAPFKSELVREKGRKLNFDDKEVVQEDEKSLLLSSSLSPPTKKAKEENFLQTIIVPPTEDDEDEDALMFDVARAKKYSCVRSK